MKFNIFNYLIFSFFIKDFIISCNTKNILWLWKGGLTDSSIILKFKLSLDARCDIDNLHILIDLEPFKDPDDLQNIQEKIIKTLSYSAMPIYKGSQVFIANITNLPYGNRKYRYRLVDKSHGIQDLILKKGYFYTPERDLHKPYSFTFGLGSCADEYGNPEVFQDISLFNPLFFLHMGDLHYSDITENNLTMYRNAYDSFMLSPIGKSMLNMDIPMDYIWDDHDFGPDNSNKYAKGKNASCQVYREVVPHYNLIHPTAIYHNFSIGRIYFIITDLRSEKDNPLDHESKNKSMMGLAQRKWFFNQLVYASTNKNIKAIFWCTTVPWIDDERKWGEFSTEQNLIVDFIKKNQLNKDVPITIISGDAHMLALDDGRFSPGNIRVFHAAALGRPGSIKGGPYSHGAFPGNGQYGIIQIKDNYTNICIHFYGYHINRELKISYNTCTSDLTENINHKTYYPPPIWIRKVMRKFKKFKKAILNSFITSHLISGLVTILFIVVLSIICYQSHKNKYTMEKKTI